MINSKVCPGREVIQTFGPTIGMPVPLPTFKTDRLLDLIYNTSPISLIYGLLVSYITSHIAKGLNSLRHCHVPFIRIDIIIPYSDPSITTVRVEIDVRSKHSIIFMFELHFRCTSTIVTSCDLDLVLAFFSSLL